MKGRPPPKRLLVQKSSIEISRGIVKLLDRRVEMVVNHFGARDVCRGAKLWTNTRQKTIRLFHWPEHPFSSGRGAANEITDELRRGFRRGKRKNKLGGKGGFRRVP